MDLHENHNAYHVYVDGSVYPKSLGDVGIGIVIEKDGLVLFQRPIKVGECATSVVAEYMAIQLGLEEISKIQATDVKIYSDNLSVVRHIKGEIAESKHYLERYKARILDLSERIGAVEFNWVPKTSNRLAHLLARRSHDTPPIVRNSNFSNGKHVELLNDVAFVEGEAGSYYRIDFETFSCSCPEHKKNGNCIHCKQLKSLMNKD
ncbi:MAG: ribonuclease HI family protein [Candidatus Hodarchaeales archaeon]|jgi:ribonuclease HI